MEMEREDEINLQDYWRVIIKRWKIIAGIFGVSVVTVAVVNLFMTPIYQAKTTIMPVESSGGRLSGSLQNLTSLPFVGGMATDSAFANKLVTVLNSRTLAEDVIRSFNLTKVLFKDRPSSLRGAVKLLIGMRKIASDRKAGYISIYVEYKDPKIAADIANYYIAALQKFLNENALSMAKRNRIFVEGQLKKVEVELSKAEEAMKSFQTNKKIVAMDAQTEAAIKALANLNAQITEKEVLLGVMKQFSTSANPDILRIKDELRELRKQLAIVESKKNNPETDAMPSFSEAPALGLQYIQLKREVLTQQKVFELLTQQYEMAKIDEAKEDITFQVIDRAIPPEERIKPKRRQNVMLAGTASLFAGAFLVFFLEYLENKKMSEKRSGKEI